MTSKRQPHGLCKYLSSSARKRFDDLLKKYDIHFLGLEQHGIECNVTYEGELLGITIHYEIATTPWVTFTDMATMEGYGLDFLIKERKGPPRPDFARFNEKARIDHALDFYASSLKKYGSDVLQGDFSIFPDLTRRSRKMARDYYSTKK